MAIGMESTCRRVQRRSSRRCTALPTWYGEAGMFSRRSTSREQIQGACVQLPTSPDQRSPTITFERTSAISSCNKNAFQAHADGAGRGDPARVTHPSNNLPANQYMFYTPDERRVHGHRPVPRRFAPADFTDTGQEISLQRLRGAQPADRCRGPRPLDQSSGSPARERCRSTGYSKAAYDKAKQSARRHQHPDPARTPTPARRCTTWPKKNGFCPMDGGAGAVARRRGDQHRRPAPINTNSGLIANGEPIGASGLRQIHELGSKRLPARPETARSPATPRSATPSSTAPRHRRRRVISR